MFFIVRALLFQLIINVLNTFFRQIKIRGSWKVPKEGPLIIAVAPHANQFIDPMMLIVSCGREIGFLAAQKSMDKFWIGLFAKALNSIGVQRPQDCIRKGTGTIHLTDPLVITGINTIFTKELDVRFCISVASESVEVATIESDTRIILKKPFESDAALALLSATTDDGGYAGVAFKITPYIDQSNMFQEVTRRLKANGCVGIFPEGGSHDRSELLPLKAGVCIMALDCLAKHPELPLRIVPCGLNYFHADKFRSRAVVEYGEPISVDAHLVEMYKNGDKRKAVATLLETLRVSLRDLTLQAPDFESLMVVQALRRLYTPPGRRLSIDQSLSIARKFAEGFLKMKDDPDVQRVTAEVLDYNHLLRYYGVKDHQVRKTSTSTGKAILLLLYRTIELLVLFLLALPALVLFSPLLILSRIVSHQKAAEAKAGSSVKIAGKDVVTTWKILTALVVVPALCILYVSLAFYVTSSYRDFAYGVSMALVAAIALPVLGWASIRISDIGLDILKSLPPLWLSLTTSESSLKTLTARRAALSARISQLALKLGPDVIPDFESNRIISPDELAENFVHYADMTPTDGFGDAGQDNIGFDVEGISLDVFS